MIQEPPSKAWIPITVAIIGGTCTVIAAIAGVVASRVLDRSMPAPTPVSTQVTVQNGSAPDASPEMLVVNGGRYPYPDSTSTPYCIAQDVYTGMDTRLSYEVTVPDSWVMVWDFHKASWENERYEDNGLLVITGPWQGTLDINTGGSCSGPVGWKDWLIDTRTNAYPIPSRPIYYLGQTP